ncbi:MAG: hypothetical protein WAN36_12765, partial [Calditrichia bacterium]
MKSIHFFSLLLVVVFAFGGVIMARPLQFEDMFAMGRVADPQISPDGKWIAYTVTRYSMEENKGNS